MKTRIGILGLGGVGGYFGGLLAKKYTDSNEIEIIFIARGETQKSIQKNGLKIITNETEFIAHPTLVSNDPAVIGKLDFLICATKTYHIEESLLSIQNCIKKTTVFLPFYNGVDAPDRIQVLFPENEILKGCAHVISFIDTPGVIKKVSSFAKFYFGSFTAPLAMLNNLQNIFKEAGIDSTLSDRIEETIWEKFIFISPLASTTSYLNRNISEIIENEDSRKLYVNLLHEITMLVAVKGLDIPHSIIIDTIQKLENAPKDATSSMHRDIIAGNKSELASLTEYVIKEGEKYEVETPNYQMVFDKLSINHEF